MSFCRRIFRRLGTQGLQFSRRADGAVEVGQLLPDDNGVTHLAVISANEWASLVSTMSNEGETGFTFGLALQFHIGGVAYDPGAANAMGCACAQDHCVARSGR